MEFAFFRRYEHSEEWQQNRKPAGLFIPLPYLHPRYLVCNVGCNNLGVGDTVAEAIAKYSTWLDFAKTRFDIIYCTSVLPINHNKFLAAFGAQKQYINMPYSKVIEFNAALVTLLAQKECTYINTIAEFLDCEEMNANLTDDGIHPNAAGYADMEAVIRANILDLTQ